MRRALFALASIGVLAAGCGPAPTPYRAVADMKTLCAEIVDPAAGRLWGAVGWIETDHGSEEIVPRTDEEWLAVHSAAITLAEAGNLMMIPPRARDQGEWMRLSAAFVDMAKDAVDAVDARNIDDVFTLGGDLYELCTNCHSKYNTGIIQANQ